MKKIILAVFVTMMMSPAYADEEIQLAAVMVESGYSATEADKMIYAAPGARGGSSNEGFEYAIVAGIVITGVLATVVDGWDSTSNH